MELSKCYAVMYMLSVNVAFTLRSATGNLSTAPEHWQVVALPGIMDTQDKTV